MDCPEYTLLVYMNDIQNPTRIDLLDEEPNINEPPSRRRFDYCKVLFNCSFVGTHNFLFVQLDDIALLQRCIHGYASSRMIESHEKSKTRRIHYVTDVGSYLP